MTKCDRNNEVLFSVGRRQFLGYTGAGMLAAVLPGCGNGDIQSAPYQQTMRSVNR
ncbi:twin-arginine translocation signal domain-containing protein [Paraburkholderia sp. BL25I1N1]|uniref:twin-arginine translocation signal domain-containing protein n=1 Tax=Paraburkholderia sp. BL25I1N1 TaxID=1938804 RepID=UPI000D437076|nr:twin-arginine translocation signal domain-containing protein [Paraburkholderia sp. BL25I1N1]PRY06655.1 TAT (twin-arginine translocation) pathway-exported protein [Paraburkholderia sp. BL25I1N1]